MAPHDDIQEQLTDYALGELPSAARARVEVHLAECPECASEARELTLAYHSMGLAETAVAPPAHLKARVLANLERESVTTVPSRASAGPRTSRPARLHPAWLALAATAVLVLGGMLVVSQQRAARLTQEVRRVDAEAARLATEAATVATQADLAVAILTATDLRRIDLQGFDVSRDATARAYWSSTRGLLIVADRLPTPPPGRTYQVWLIGSGSAGPVSAGLIDGRRTGRGMLIVPPPGGVGGGTVTVAVTDEPDGGLPAPTGSKHLAGSL
jgi:anti-sigma-K factor RskA